MNRPRVIIHNLTSLDGRLDGFPAYVGLTREIRHVMPYPPDGFPSTTPSPARVRHNRGVVIRPEVGGCAAPVFGDARAH